MLTERDIGTIKAYMEIFDRNISAVARATNIHRRTIAKYASTNYAEPSRERKQANKVVLRRRRLAKLASERIRKGGRIWPKYGSASQLRVALYNTTGELISPRTIQRDLNESGLTSYVRTKVPTRTAKDVAHRSVFKREMSGWSKKKLRSIVFSDESWLTCIEKTGRKMWARSRADVLPLERKCRWNVPSVMIWAAVGVGFKSPIVILPSKRTQDGELVAYRLDAERYIRKCIAPVVKSLNEQRRIFMQDGARSHVSKKTLSYLDRKMVNYIRGWPPYSPDWNAIERVWADLQNRIGARCPMSVDELIEVATDEWNKLPQQLIDNHCEHFVNQMKL